MVCQVDDRKFVFFSMVLSSVKTFRSGSVACTNALICVMAAWRSAELVSFTRSRLGFKTPVMFSNVSIGT